jgi:prophage regulatory protein
VSADPSSKGHRSPGAGAIVAAQPQFAGAARFVVNLSSEPLTRAEAHAQLLDHVGHLTCLRLPEVCRRVGLGETALRQMMMRGEFPPPFKLGVRAVGWLASDVDNWIAHRAARRVMFKP